MDSTHLHLVVNHFPIVGSFIGTVILIFGIILNSSGILRKTSFILLIGVAIAALVTFYSGEGAEHAVEKIPGIAESYIEEHEDHGKLFLTAAIITGVLSALGLLYEHFAKRNFKLLSYAVIFAALATCLFAIQTGNSGGEIRHTEIRTDAGSAPDSGNLPENESDHGD